MTSKVCDIVYLEVIDRNEKGVIMISHSLSLDLDKWDINNDSAP